MIVHLLSYPIINLYVSEVQSGAAVRREPVDRGNTLGSWELSGASVIVPKVNWTVVIACNVYGVINDRHSPSIR